MQGLLNERVISRAEFDRATAEHRQTDARVGEIRAAIERKTIRAPFSGILGIRQVNLGQYLSGGDALVTLQSLNPIYVNFGVPQQSAGQMRVGRTVRDHRRRSGAASQLHRARHGHRLDGRRGDPEHPGAGDARQSRRHAAARHVRADRGRRSAPASGVVALPASAISYAPYGDSVFVVTDMKD